MMLEDSIREKHSGDEEHLEFIFSDDKKIIVTAPAGCGKTTAMVSKVAREISVGNIAANKKVLALTFSVNAAMKIKDSLKALLPDLVDNKETFLAKVDIANYHNFAMRILFKHGYTLNSEFVKLSEFRVVDDSSEIINTFLTSSDGIKLKNLDDAVKDSGKEAVLAALNDYWDILNRKLVTNHIITYNGILVSAIKLLMKCQISSFYKEYYRMIIVDEFQDTNMLGYLLIKKLIGDNIVVFLGDDIQKIYGFLGAVDGIFDMFIESYPITQVAFHNNYRFDTNQRMKDLDLLIRDCAENYRPSELEATILLKNLNDDEEEDAFVVRGIDKIVSDSEDKVAVLVRAGWQGDSIASKLDEQNIKYFNALFKESDSEYLDFYRVAIEEFHREVHGKAVRKNLQKCLEGVRSREHEIYNQGNRKFIFDAMYTLLEVLFTTSKEWEGTSVDRYESIDFTLGNKGLKRMMEFIDERVVLTTIHSAKGLEWEYVIIPRLNGYAFPVTPICKACSAENSCNSGFDYCKFLYAGSAKKKFLEELSVLYVAVTRAKKDVFMTVNTGLNQYNYPKRVSCLINLEGIITADYEWENLFQ